jgi:hypothetical protein
MVLSFFYAGSVVFGRIYCGMHGFLGEHITDIVSTF